MWIEGQWSECRVQVPEDHCGAGIQNRTILCVRTSGKKSVAFWGGFLGVFCVFFGGGGLGGL